MTCLFHYFQKLSAEELDRYNQYCEAQRPGNKKKMAAENAKKPAQAAKENEVGADAANIHCPS